MNNIKIHVMRTGEVRVSPYLPFGGDRCSMLKASGLTTPKKDWLWLPVFSFLLEHPKGKILFDAGWSREMSPNGVYDKAAQIKSLGSRLLYMINQGRVAKGEAVDEQLAARGVRPSDLDYVLLSHLDCDHANGLRQVADAKHILVSAAEMEGARRKTFQARIRFQKRWWSGVVMVNIPGHSEGLCALKLKNDAGKFVLLFADGGYASRSIRSFKNNRCSGFANSRYRQTA